MEIEKVILNELKKETQLLKAEKFFLLKAEIKK